MDDQQQYYSYEGISEDQPPKHNFLLPIIVLIIIVVIGGGAVLFLTGKISNPFKKTEQKSGQITQKSLPTATTRTQIAKKPTQKALQNNLASIVSSAATASNYSDITKYITLAGKEPSLDKSYQDYVKAYSAMVIAYKETKDPKYLTAMSNLKKVVVRYPEYVQGDFPAP